MITHKQLSLTCPFCGKKMIHRDTQYSYKWNEDCTKRVRFYAYSSYGCTCGTYAEVDECSKEDVSIVRYVKGETIKRKNKKQEYKI